MQYALVAPVITATIAIHLIQLIARRYILIHSLVLIIIILVVHNLNLSQLIYQIDNIVVRGVVKDAK